MTDKERLEEIKNSSLKGLHILFGTSWVSMPKENFEWLIHQAEKVEDLEEINIDAITQIDVTQRRNERLEKRVYELEGELAYYKMATESYLDMEQQNKRYREALNSIITLWIASTDATDDTWLAHEMSETARKALEGENNDC